MEETVVVSLAQTIGVSENRMETDRNAASRRLRGRLPSLLFIRMAQLFGADRAPEMGVVVSKVSLVTVL